MATGRLSTGSAIIIADLERHFAPEPLTPPAFDTTVYRARNLIERAFCRLKDWRGIATRYDKKAKNFLAGICLVVAVTDWLR